MPDLPPLPANRTTTAGVFELGLCMAGAISAGAYTAGVLDYLIEALDAFAAERAERARDGRAPLHEVRLLALGGASAGGICSGIASIFADKQFPPVRPDTPAEMRRRNPLWRAWVEDIDIRRLLETRDVAGGRAAPSLLDCTVLEEIVDGLLDARPKMPTAHRPWLANPLRSILTLSNLRGVPHGMPFEGSKSFRLWMTSHADYLRYVVPLEPGAGAVAALPQCQGETLLLRDMPRGGEARDRFKRVVLGTSAFPLALAPRVIARDVAEYDRRAAETPTSGLGGLPASPDLPDALRHAKPNFAPNKRPDPYRALCVDGGAMNNQPLELVRQALAGWAGTNIRDAAQANRAIILIEPFVNKGGLGPMTSDGLFGTLLPLFHALIANSRFKPEDLALAAADEVASRFMIAPSRGAGWEGEGAIASGYLGGFLGFFDQAYRAHDFFLGRRNAETFLRWIFVLPETNALFRQGRWAERDMADWAVHDTQRPPPAAKDAPRMLPILPLCGALRAEAATPRPLPDWPAGACDPAAIRQALHDRTARILPEARRQAVRALIGGGVAGGLVNGVASLLERRLVTRATDAAMAKIAAQVAAVDRAEVAQSGGRSAPP